MKREAARVSYVEVVVKNKAIAPGSLTRSSKENESGHTIDVRRVDALQPARDVIGVTIISSVRALGGGPPRERDCIQAKIDSTEFCSWAVFFHRQSRSESSEAQSPFRRSNTCSGTGDYRGNSFSLFSKGS